MTEPDEALLWAREELVKVWEQSNASRKDIAIRVPAIRAGDYDGYLHYNVYLRKSWLEGYRDAAAASAERIKELEAELEKVSDLLSDAIQADCEHGVRSLNEAAAANYLKDFPHTREALTDIQAVCRSMLKDPDQ